MNRLSKDITQIIGWYIHQSLQNEVHEMLLEKTENVKGTLDIISLENNNNSWMYKELFTCIRKCVLCLRYVVSPRTAKIKFECFRCSSWVRKCE